MYLCSSQGSPQTGEREANFPEQVLASEAASMPEGHAWPHARFCKVCRKVIGNKSTNENLVRSPESSSQAYRATHHCGFLHCR
jgi:hypothetical protein